MNQTKLELLIKSGKLAVMILIAVFAIQASCQRGSVGSVPKSVPFGLKNLG